MELIERVPLREVHFLNSLTFETYRIMVSNNYKSTNTKTPSIKDQRVLYDKIKQFCKSVIKTRGVTKRIYSYSLSTPDGSGGRLFCGGALQGLPNRFRSLLLRGMNTTDIDQVNAHPTILLYICKKHNIICPYLEYYINNRDLCLNEFPTRDEGKKVYLIATNTDKKIKTQYNHLKNYDVEMKRIQKEIVAIEEYKSINSNLQTDKENYNGSAINRILCYYENIILQNALSAINKRGIEVAVLVFDGLVIYGNHYEDTSLLSEITTYVNEQMEGLNMRWSYKPFDTSLTVPETFDENAYEGKKTYRPVRSEDEAANLIYDEVKSILIPANKRLFLKKDNIWIDDINDINDFLLQHILSSNITKANNKEEFIPYAQNVKTAKNIREDLIGKIKTNYNGPNIYEKFHSTTKNRLAFIDGVLDFKTKTFYRWDDIPFEYYSTRIINRCIGDWIDRPNLDAVNEIKEKIFDTLFNSKVDMAIHFLSRAMAGCIEDKNIATYLGSRDCGKGVIFELLKNAFGDYVSSFSINNMLYERATDTTETSRKLYWLLDYEFVRLAISQETPSPEDKLKVNCKLLKLIASGGDEQDARRNFDRVDTKFKLDTTLFSLGNYALNFDSADVMEHCIEFSSTVQFKTKNEIDRMRSEGESELLLNSFKIRDDNIKTKCKTEDWNNACVYLLFKNYKDFAVPIYKNNETMDESEYSVRKLLLVNYDITGDKEDCIIANDVFEKIGGCKKKITNELLSFGVEKKKSNRRNETKDKMCFFGMKKKKENDIATEEKKENDIATEEKKENDIATESI
jgi:hypothetical protein